MLCNINYLMKIKIMTISENNRLMETFMYKFKNSDTDTKKLIVQKIVEYYNRF